MTQLKHDKHGKIHIDVHVPKKIGYVTPNDVNFQNKTESRFCKIQHFKIRKMQHYIKHESLLNYVIA